MAKETKQPVSKKDAPIASTWEVVADTEMKDVSVRPQVLREVALALQANQHRSTANAKRRGEVRGGGKKPWRQKGTGRARVGSSRTPLWRGGGVIFGPLKTKNYQQKLTTDMRRQALLGALRLKIQAGKVGIANVDVNTVKTKSALEQLSDALSVAPVLVVIPVSNLAKVLRNVSGVKVTAASRLNALDVMAARRIIFINDSYTDLKKKLKV